MARFNGISYSAVGSNAASYKDDAEVSACVCRCEGECSMCACVSLCVCVLLVVCANTIILIRFIVFPHVPYSRSPLKARPTTITNIGYMSPSSSFPPFPSKARPRVPRPPRVKSKEGIHLTHPTGAARGGISSGKRRVDVSLQVHWL